MEWNSTCFWQFLCPWSGFFHCSHNNGICHTGLLTAYEQEQMLLLTSCQHKLYDIYHCCVYSEKLLMIDKGTVGNMKFHSKNKFEKLVQLVGLIIRNLTRCTVTWKSNMNIAKIYDAPNYMFRPPSSWPCRVQNM